MRYPTMAQLQRVYQKHIERCQASPMSEYACVCGGCQIITDVANGEGVSSAFYECPDCGRPMSLSTWDGAELCISRDG
jgi:hypothetical protein